MKQQVNITMTLEVDTTVGMGELESNLTDAASYHGGKFQGLVSVISYDYKEEAQIYAPTTTDTMLIALKVAEDFMSGFEDDPCQETIKQDLATVRAAIAGAA